MKNNSRKSCKLIPTKITTNKVLSELLHHIIVYLIELTIMTPSYTRIDLIWFMSPAKIGVIPATTTRWFLRFIYANARHVPDRAIGTPLEVFGPFWKAI